MTTNGVCRLTKPNLSPQPNPLQTQLANVDNFDRAAVNASRSTRDGQIAYDCMFSDEDASETAIRYCKCRQVRDRNCTGKH